MILKENRSSLDIYSKIVTILFCVLILGLFYSLLTSKSLNSVSIIIIITCILIILAVSSSFPLKIILSDQEVIIKKLIGSVRIPLKNVVSVSVVTTFPISMTISSKGFLGYLGTTMDGGRSYVTNSKNVISLKTENNKIYLISPDNKPEFLKDIREHVK